VYLNYSIRVVERLLRFVLEWETLLSCYFYGFVVCRAMSTFTAIALDRLIEPGASNPADKSTPTSIPIPNSQKLERSTKAPANKSKAPRPPWKPALYSTPVVTPLPETPSSFPPSPYIINHKRRGPSLLIKSSSDVDIRDDENVNEKSFDGVVASSAGDLHVTFANTELVKEDKVHGAYDGELDNSNGAELACPREAGSSSLTDYLLKEKPQPLNLDRVRELEDFFDPPESLSFASNTDGEENAADLSMKFSSPIGEYYDAWEGKLC